MALELNMFNHLFRTELYLNYPFPLMHIVKHILQVRQQMHLIFLNFKDTTLGKHIKFDDFPPVLATRSRRGRHNMNLQQLTVTFSLQP